MTYEQVLALEAKLQEKGYRKTTSCKIIYHDDYEWYKPFYIHNGHQEKELMYQIFFCFYDFEKYRSGAGYGVDIKISPESCENNVGRRDLSLSVDWFDDIKRVEACAYKFYNFITEIDKNES